MRGWIPSAEPSSGKTPSDKKFRKSNFLQFKSNYSQTINIDECGLYVVTYE